MKAQTVDVKESTGRILCCTIFRPGGRKLLAKGHVLSQDDVRLLETEGLQHVWVTELEQGEIGEDDAVCQAAREIGCGCLEIRLAAGGRANLFATEDCCVLIDDELLKQINCISSIVIATGVNFNFAKSGQRIATVKSAPFAIPQSQLLKRSSIFFASAAPSCRPGRSVAHRSPFCIPISSRASAPGIFLKGSPLNGLSVSGSLPVSCSPALRRKPPWLAASSIFCAPTLR